MTFKHWPFVLCLLWGLVGCQNFGCEASSDSEGWHLLNFPEVPQVTPLAETPSPPAPQAPSPSVLALKKPKGYVAAKHFPVLAGVRYFQFETKSKDPTQTLRAIHVLPRSFGHLQVLFSDHWDHPLSLHTVGSRQNVIAAMNWSFIGRIPGADMIGQRCKLQGRSCHAGAYTNSEKRTGQNTHHRWTVGLKKDRNQIHFFKGGLSSNSTQWYRLAMGGGVLLFDRSHQPKTYQSVGSANYARYYTDPRNNERKIIRSGQAGELFRKAPRSAMGLLSDGSFVYLNIGEGKYHFEGGVSPFELAKIMKTLGCLKAVMFDGGGAPVMQIKDRRGRVLVKTQPEHKAGSNYHYNYAFLTLTASPNHR